MSNCRFCEIIKNHESLDDEEVVFENNEFIVITDKYRKTSAGSICLIIPKEHYSNLLEINEELEISLIKVIKLVSKAVEIAFDCKGLRIWTAVNKEAGQSIFHLHVHIVPCNSIMDRFIAAFPGVYDLALKIMKFGRNKLNKNQNFEFAEKIRTQIKKLVTQG